MARRKRFANTKAQLKAFGKAWLKDTRDNASGPVLKKRTEKLFNSITLKDETNKSPMTVTITAEALDPKTGFPYAAFHEFISGRSYIRLAQQFVMSKWFSKKTGGSIIERAAARDSEDLFIDYLVAQPGWTGAPVGLRGLTQLPNTAFRVLRVNLGKGGGFEGTLARVKGFFGKPI